MENRLPAPLHDLAPKGWPSLASTLAFPRRCFKLCRIKHWGKYISKGQKGIIYVKVFDVDKRCNTFQQIALKSQPIGQEVGLLLIQTTCIVSLFLQSTLCCRATSTDGLSSICRTSFLFLKLASFCCRLASTTTWSGRLFSMMVKLSGATEGDGQS